MALWNTKLSRAFRHSNMGPALIKAGDSTTQITCSVANTNMIQLYTKATNTTGTTRGIYNRLYIAGSSGTDGEATRSFTTVMTTVTGSVHGTHTSLSIGTSGVISGSAYALRATLQVPNSTLAGTTGAIFAELYAEGASSANSGKMALIAMDISGNATGITALTQQAGVYAFSFGAGCVDATNGVIDSDRTTNTASGCIKINVNGTTRWITYGTGA